MANLFCPHCGLQLGSKRPGYFFCRDDIYCEYENYHDNSLEPLTEKQLIAKEVERIRNRLERDAIALQKLAKQN